ncbi:MAG: extracellular solute-binding protein, partial [Phycisphaerales bacterium]|nr:extracellular solute-binding protein [Phycisphaerales bacterium]
TLYDSILNKEGWDRGWRILREMSANARYFTASSTQPPLDVSQGECVMGVAIDFYGRGQSQAVLRTGQRPEESRVGYIDPPGATYIDADPASIVNGTRRPEMAKRFMTFLLTDEAQALWQFAPARGPGRDSGAGQAAGAGVMIEDAGTQIRLGPVEYSLRRMPSRRAMYERYLEHFTDKTNPFQIASNTPLRGWRDLLGPLMGAFAIDSRQEMKAAWAALNAARTTPGFPSATLADMEAAFYAFPTQTVIDKDGKSTDLPLTEQNYRAISEYTKRWRDPDRGPAARIAYTRFFQTQYRRVVEMYESARPN